MSADIFISYRGADRVLARKLENRLRSRWGSRVFRDETGVTSGRHWAKELTDAMQEARVIIALIGPGWQISSDEKDDWVRRELATAVNGAKPILPVLVGKSEELRPKLASMPEAFQRQAVVVGPELAGFDIYRIARVLGQLGAFRTDDASTLASRRDEMVPKSALEEAEQAIAAGRSLLIVGSSGSGRNALVNRLVDDQVKQGNLVATYGLECGVGLRHTHALISGWIKSLSDVFADLNSPYSAKNAGRSLVKSVLEAGPDLLSRRVVKASTLLPLGGTRHDQMILEAVRRSTDRWAPFPPTRLRHQSRAVLESLVAYLRAGPTDISILGDKKLILVVDHFDSIDGISGDLVHELLTIPIAKQCNQIQFIIAAYDAGLNARSEIRKWLSTESLITRIDIQESTAWGDHLQPWLEAHKIDLDDSVKKLIEDESNPYRALAKLWYLVDNGLVKEPPRTHSDRKSAMQDSDGRVKWQVADEGEDPLAAQDLLSDHRLLDHMVEEHVPVGFRSLVEAGALLGRTFSFHAAYAAIQPPAPDDKVEEPLSSRERDTWAEKARAVWEELKTIDPERTVLSCTESDTGELLVSFAQADLIGHLRNGLSARTARDYHERLARYLVDPIEQLNHEDFGDQYYRADLAAEHWSMAGRPRDAADAHRRAAQLAEISLDYVESRRHYGSAIRLYTQLIAEGREPARDHEDLLILANCFYRVGQTTRLEGNPSRGDEDWGAINYLERALDRLRELKDLLLENDPDRRPEGVTGQQTRGIPAPNLVSHHLRVYNAVSGHVHLELAQCYETAVDECRSHTGDELHSCSECRHNNRLVRDRLFDALRHAEAARGEAGSRWLLAAASARLATLLTDESLRTELADKKRSDELSVEAFFHIERIIGLRPCTNEEEQEFADPVSVAWRSAGRLFRHGVREGRIAEWCYRKMNDHGPNVTTTVDMATDRWLGGFLLSICTPGESGPTIDQAKALLLRHRNWVIESGIVDGRTRAHLRLYLLALVENGADPVNHEARREHLRIAGEDALSDRHRRECRLFEALEVLISAGADQSGSEKAVALFREALPECDGQRDDDILQKGVSRLARMLLRRCPKLIGRVNDILGPLLVVGRDDIDVSIQRADEYVESLKLNRILSPCIDSVIDRLAKSRLLPNVYSQAIETKQVALKLLKMHQKICIHEEGVDLNVLICDVEYAAFMHDWYSGTDPARLLALASEWNLKVSGEEWANPRLLQGRLASMVMKIMYGAETVLGTSRYQRITNMVDNCVVGRPDASALAKVFFLANAISEHSNEKSKEKSSEPKWLKAVENEEIDDAYRMAIKRKEQAPWDLGYVHGENAIELLMPADDVPPLDEEPDLSDVVVASPK